MNSKIEHSKDNSANGGDIVKYVAASLLVLAGLFVWFWFSADSGRAAQLGAWAGQLRCIGGRGRSGWRYRRVHADRQGARHPRIPLESRFELRKVVWPTRQEAVRMTWVVIVVVLILSLLLGGFDFLIQKLTQWFLSR